MESKPKRKCKHHEREDEPAEATKAKCQPDCGNHNAEHDEAAADPNATRKWRQTKRGLDQGRADRCENKKTDA